MRGAGRVPVVVALSALGVGAASSVAPHHTPSGIVIDDSPSCNLHLPPQHHGTTGVLEAGSSIPLDVLVLLDGVTAEEAMPELRKAAASYEPLGIELRFAEPQYFTPNPDDLEATSEGYIPMSEYNDAARDHFGGQRPDGIEVVYTLTTFDFKGGFGLYYNIGPLHDGHQLGENDYAGEADCIGGIALPETGFAVGEWLPAGRYPDDLVHGPIGSLTTHVFAHEVGHLLGGTHELADCFAGLLYEAPDEPNRRCTLMSASGGPMSSSQFHPLNRSVVRAYVEEHAN